MNLSRNQKILIVVVALGVSFASGRYTVPEKIKIETKTVEVEKRVDDKTVVVKKDTHRKVTKVEVTKPDGEKTVTTITTVDNSSNTHKDELQTDNKTASTDTLKEVTKAPPSAILSVLGGFNVNSSTPVYGISAQARVIGPITVGVWGTNSSLNSLTIGAQAGILF